MIWAALSLYGLSKIILTSGNRNACCYINNLVSGLLPFVASTFSQSHPWVFQQDNASTHTAMETCKWLTERQIRTLPWPAKFPHLNIIEFLGMVRTIYKSRKQYSTVNELKKANRDFWDEIN